jgi:flagellar protein FliO/FliZ
VDAGGYFRFVVALAFVLALIGAMAWLARRFGFAPPPRLPGQPRRLKVIESLALDARRRLVLVSRDATEHLLLVGGANELTVESGIRPPEVPAPSASPEPKP